MRALLKKQWLESVAFLFHDKNGKRRSPLSAIGILAVLIIGLASVCFLFYMMGQNLCAAFVAQGNTWLYFAFMGTIATAFGIIGSIFMAKATLYEAKDNDLLFSMPIPSWVVLASRTVGLYLFTLLFEGLVFAPATVCYFVEVGFSAKVLFGSIFTLLIMPFGALAVCLLLGWLLAVIAAKLPWKNALTVLFSLGFMVLYFVGYSKIYDFLNYVVAHGGEVAKTMQTWLFPFWKMGVGATGKPLALLLYALIFIGLFACVYAIVSVTYLRLVTANRGGKKKKYISKERKQGAPVWALLKKEIMRFTKNPMVALNCFLGSIFLVIMPFAALFIEELSLLGGLGIDEPLAMILAIILCAMGSTNMLAAASVSLEGENIWITHSMPVQTEKILFVKAFLHWLTVAIPLTFATIFLCIYLKISFWFSVLALFAGLFFAAFTALLGLLMNLKMPNLHWTNELTAVKQSMAAVVSMFAEWGAVALLVVGYFLFGKYLFAGGYFLVCILLLGATCALLTAWIFSRGKKIFEELS